MQLVSKLYVGLIPWSPSLFLFGYICRQKRKLKLESAKIECFFEIFNSHNSTKIQEKSPDFYGCGSSNIAKKIANF